jgi:hypothetical protein
LAAVLDAVENLALVIILFGVVESPYPEIAKWCAVIKFIIVFMGIMYGLIGLLAGILHRFSD